MLAEIVSVENVSFGYDSSLSLENVSFKAYEGDFLGIVGPNGAGKTTLFRCMLRVPPRVQGNNKIVWSGHTR